MKKIIASLLAGLVCATTSTSCVSYAAHKNWAEAKSKNAVRVAADGEQVAVGVDITKLTYIKEHPWMALGAGLADAGIAYGIYYAADKMVGGSDDKNTEASYSDTGNAGRDNTSISINGNGNSVNISDNNNTTTTTNGY